MYDESDSNGTLAIIALDAADYRLAQEWDCGNILLDNSDQIETFAYSNDVPTTLEVWTSVATGVHPEEHGISSTGEQQEWENPLLRTGSTVASRFLPKSLRVHLGTILRNDEADAGMTFRQTDHDHVFQDGDVYGWPGITPATHLSKTWHWLNLAKQGEITDDELWQRLYANVGKEIGWVIGTARTPHPVIGVHSHILDAAGHAFATREEKLREIYEEVDRMLGAVRRQVDRLVVMSDHGMQVDSVPKDDEPGQHSWRATFATTESGSLPESIFDVRDWLAARTDAQSERTTAATFDTTRDQLEELGYL